MPKVSDSRINPGDGTISYNETKQTTIAIEETSGGGTRGGVRTVLGDNIGEGHGIYAGSNGQQDVVIDFRTIVAGAGISIKSDANTLTLSSTGVISTNLNDLDGVLSVENGGTGSTTFTPNALILGNAQGPLQSFAPPATANQMLTWDGTAYVWDDIPVVVDTGIQSITVNGASSKVAVTGGTITDTGTITIDVVESNIPLNNLQGTLSVSKGGTGVNTFTHNGIVFGSGSGLSATSAPSVAGQVLAWNGANFAWNIPGSVSSVGLSAGSAKVIVTGSTITSSGSFAIDVDETKMNITSLSGVLGVTKGGTGLTALGSPNTFLRVNGSGTGLEYVTISQNQGTVTSVGLTAGSDKVFISGGPITTNGNITVDVVEANLNFANISGTVSTAKGGTGLTTIGTAKQVLRVTAAGNALEYSSLTASDVSGFSTVATTGSYTDLSNKPTYSSVASSGDYADLTNKPALAAVAISGSYNDLSDKPTNIGSGTVTSVALTPGSSKISVAGGTITTAGSITVDVVEHALNLNNQVGVLLTTKGGTGLSTIGTAKQVLRVNEAGTSLEYDSLTVDDVSGLATVATTGSYSDLSGKPALALVATSGSYDDLSNRPSFSTVATTGSYTDLINKPTIPTVSQVGSTGEYADLLNAPTFSLVAFSGDYEHLTNKPTNLGSGTVTSVGLTAGSPKVLVTGGPITTNGSITVDINESNLTLNNMTGTLSVSKGGTGRSSFTVNGLLIGNDNSPFTSVDSPVDANTFLKWDGASYVWALPGGVGSITAGQGLSTTPSSSTDGGAITGSGTLHLTDTGVIAGSYGVLGGTVDEKGRLTSVVDKSADVLNRANHTGTQAVSTITGLATVATSGSYTDLSNTPTLFSGSYTDLTDKPILFSGAYADLTGKPVLFSGSYTDLTDKPVLFDGDYASLTNTPILFSGSYTDLTNKPTFATVAFSGSYSDLVDVPSGVPGSGTVTSVSFAAGSTKLSVTGSPITGAGTITVDVNEANLSLANIGGTIGVAQITGLSTVATTGAYSDLIGTPTLFSGSYIDLTDKPVLFDGDYNLLTNKPVIPTVPTLVSAFTNDAGYLVAADISGKADTASLATVATTGEYADLLNKPTLFSGAYADLTGLPVLFDGAYSSLTGVPVLATVATSGSYADLTNKPVLFSGSYNDLSDKPSIPTQYTDAMARSAISLNAGTSGATYNNTTGILDLSGLATGSGEVNTASNIGATGVGLFHQKSGVDLQFKKLIAGSNVTLTDNGDTVTIDADGGGGSVVPAGSTANGTFTFVSVMNAGNTTTNGTDAATVGISNLPTGWSVSVAGGVTTITHNVGKPPKDVHFYVGTGSTTNPVYVMIPGGNTAATGLVKLAASGTTALNTTSFQYQLASSMATIANGTVHILVTF